jgi:hypothetical protein
LRRIALATVLPAAFPYLRPDDFFFVGMRFPPPKIREICRL